MGDEADRINDVAPDPSTTISIDFNPPKKRRKAPGEAAGTRQEHDKYDTDPGLALSCVEWVHERGLLGNAEVVQNAGFYPPARSTFRILEPTAGGGPFVKAARQVWPRAVIAAVDIRPECQLHCEVAGANRFACADSTALDPKTIHSADCIITNPPFKLADALARHFYAHMHDGAVMAFLLNVTFIGSEGRWCADPDCEKCNPTPDLFIVAPLSYVIPIVPRPSFLMIDGKATSPKFEAALFVWVKGEAGENFELGRVPHAEGARIPTQPIRWEKSK